MVMRCISEKVRQADGKNYGKTHSLICLVTAKTTMQGPTRQIKLYVLYSILNDNRNQTLPISQPLNRMNSQNNRQKENSWFANYVFLNFFFNNSNLFQHIVPKIIRNNARCYRNEVSYPQTLFYNEVFMRKYDIVLFFKNGVRTLRSMQCPYTAYQPKIIVFHAA